METTSAIHQIFIDFENTQTIDLSLIHNKAVRVVLLIGDKQKNLPINLVKQLLTYASKIQIIETQCAGKNALDFILAFYLGQACSLNKKHCFYIISKDKGYDSLVQHLKLSDIQIERYDEFSLIPLFLADKSTQSNKIESNNTIPSQINSNKIDLKNTQLITGKNELNIIIEHLNKHSKNRPKKQESLLAYLNASFKKQLPNSDGHLLLNQLVQRKLITIHNTNQISYHF